MNATILLSTILVELAIGLLGFISMQLRSSAKRRKLAKLPSWEQVPFSFKSDYLSHSDDKGAKASKFMKPRSRRV
jgi:hypothetical protein